MPALFVCGLLLYVADVLFLGGVEHKVADSNNDRVNAGPEKKEESDGSGLEALGLEGGVVDDQRADRAKEPNEECANDVLGVHFENSFHA